MPPCEFEETVMMLWDGELGQPRHEEVCRHIGACKECQSTLDTLAALSTLANSAAELERAGRRRVRRAINWN